MSPTTMMDQEISARSLRSLLKNIKKAYDLAGSRQAFASEEELEFLKDDMKSLGEFFVECCFSLNALR